MLSFLSEKELSQSNTIYLVSMDALEEKTELSIFSSTEHSDIPHSLQHTTLPE